MFRPYKITQPFIQKKTLFYSYGPDENSYIIKDIFRSSLDNIVRFLTIQVECDLEKIIYNDFKILPLSFCKVPPIEHLLFNNNNYLKPKIIFLS